MGHLDKNSLDLGIMRHEGGDLAGAERIYRKLLESVPGDTQVLHLLGVLKLQSGRLQEGIDLLQTVLRSNPQMEQVHYHLGKAFMGEERWEEAAEAFTKAVEIDPDYVEAFNNWGTALSELNRPEEAMSRFLRGLEIDPECAELHFNLGNTLGDLGRTEESIAAYAKAIEIDPEFAEAHMNLGHAFKESARLEEAVTSFQQAVKLKPGYVGAITNLGLTLSQLGKVKEAIALHEKSLEIAPGNGSARHELAALKGENPEHPPKEYIQTLFNQYARKFDRHLVHRLQYKIPGQLRDFVGQVRGDAGRFSQVLDLGCGTGLCGEAFRDVAEHLTGIDLASKMITAARRKNIYDTLVESELCEFLTATDQRYDLFIAADVLIYVGKLEGVFAGIRQCGRPGGLLAFSIETADTGEFTLLPNGRYAHSNHYIKTLAARYQFRTVFHQSTPIRKTGTQWVSGASYVLELQSS